jgi:DNA-binding XRE family transcriptional regulator
MHPKYAMPLEASPVADLRGQLTQEQFAHRLGMSRIALLRFEQGLIPDPSLKLKNFLPPTMPWESFVEDYHAYQESKRKSNYGILTDEPVDYSIDEHPFITWREASNGNLTHTQVCTALCLHLPVMHRFVNGPHPQLVPDLLLDALVDAGYPPEVVSDFVLAYSHWRSRRS